MDFSAINFLAVLAAGIASFALGALWYSPLLFGKAWQKALGFSDEYLQSGNMLVIFGSSFVLMLIMAFGMAMMLGGQSSETAGWMGGLKLGLFIGLLFVGTSMGINVLYQRKSFDLWAIDAGYQILFLAIMGTIIGAWS